MSDSGHIIGESNPYHSNFRGSYLNEIASRDEQIATLRELAAVRDELLRRQQSRADAAEAKLAFLKSKGLTVAMAKDADQPERLVYVIEEGSELCDLKTLGKLTDAEVKLARIKAAADADETDLKTMRDGTKLTRHGLVQTLAYWREEVDAAEAKCRELEVILTGTREDFVVSQRYAAQLQAKLAAVREAGQGVLDWYDRDGSVGGACDPMEGLRAACKAATLTDIVPPS